MGDLLALPTWLPSFFDIHCCCWKVCLHCESQAKTLATNGFGADQASFHPFYQGLWGRSGKLSSLLPRGPLTKIVPKGLQAATLLARVIFIQLCSHCQNLLLCDVLAFHLLLDLLENLLVFGVPLLSCLHNGKLFFISGPLGLDVSSPWWLVWFDHPDLDPLLSATGCRGGCCWPLSARVALSARASSSSWSSWHRAFSLLVQCPKQSWGCCALLLGLALHQRTLSSFFWRKVAAILVLLSPHFLSLLPRALVVTSG